MTLIRELAHYDKERVDRNVTDLLWFYSNPQDANIVARSFLFSVSSDLSRDLVPNQDFDSLEILWHVLTSYDRAQYTGTGGTGKPATVREGEGGGRNRVVVIGGYGWGKSSLAVVAANFLGLPVGNAGYEAVLTALDPDSGTSPRQLVSKREPQKPKFTICLKGSNRDFHDLFIGGVSASKERYRDLLEKQGYDLTVKCEYDAANDWLSKLKDLAPFQALVRDAGVNLGQLVTGLSKLERQALATADRLWRKHNLADEDTRPSWYQKTEITQYLKQLVEAAAAPNSPFDGVLVLFDELGLWLDYANQNQSEAGGPEFLAFMEAVPQYAGKLTVCSFIQADIESFVGRDSASSNVRHMSERLGTKVRYSPDLELVLQSAIKQEKEAKRELWKRYEGEADRLAEMLIKTFPRYSQGSWQGRESRVKDILVKKCWPIHPFMAAAVCHLRFGQGHRVISILANQFDKMAGRPSDDATGRLTWTIPIDVVDFYESNFMNLHVGDEERTLWDRYVHAKTTLRTQENDPRIQVLKAVFLCHALAREMRVDVPEDFPTIIALMTGLALHDVKRHLEELSEPQGTTPPVLIHNQASGWYEFYSLEQNPAEARSWIHRQFDNAAGFDLAILEAEDEFRRVCPVQPTSFALKRHVQEHSYQTCFETILDYNKLTSAQLISLAKGKILSEVDPAHRGLHVNVLWSPTKIQGSSTGSTPPGKKVLEGCQKILNEAWAQLKKEETPIPIALSVPLEPPTELYRAIGLVACARGLPSDDKKRLGQGLEVFLSQEVKTIQRHVSPYRSGSRLTFLLPEIEGDPILANVKRGSSIPRNERMATFYEAVYDKRPPLNHRTLGDDGSKSVVFCRAILHFLMNPKHEKPTFHEHWNAVESVLLASANKESSWMAVTAVSGRFEIDEPQNPHAYACYKAFDTSLRAIAKTKKRVSLKTLWKKLSVAPYGLDIRSYALLFGVWYSKHRDECDLIKAGTYGKNAPRMSWEEVARDCERKSGLFALVEWEPFFIELRDRAAENTKIADLRSAMRKWDRSAEFAQGWIRDVSAMEPLAPTSPDWPEVMSIRAQVQEVLRDLEVCEKRVQDLRKEAESNVRLDNLGDYLTRLSTTTLPDVTSKSYDQSLRETIALFGRRAKQAVDQLLKRDYPSAEVELHEIERAIEHLGKLPLADAAKNLKFAAWPNELCNISEMVVLLRAAGKGVSAKHHTREDEQAKARAFEAKILALVPQGLASLSLKETRDRYAQMEQLATGCPSGARSSLESSLRQVGHQVARKEEAINEWLGIFGATSASPEKVLRALDDIDRFSSIAQGAAESSRVMAISKSKEALKEAAEAYRVLLGSPNASFSQLRDGADNLSRIAGELPIDGRGSVLSWHKEIETRKQLWKRRADERFRKVSEQVRAVKDSTTALQLMSDIRQFASEERELYPQAEQQLLTPLTKSVAEFAPIQIAEILKPLATEERKIVLEKALGLLNKKS